ncbi:AhpD family alkylhydroperoxidase [Actinokineospora baliensis]|uniref:carboxymuconolactone decarboxylase family protein n=1 Tax=Actinokineospora baliensis TaxID=547056 RepID=UPI001EF950CC|nr:carboxymuconolactone decarboxylase family protein [Actinokineospora baliensis]MBM7774739.1 AhpD family alkylhydroperoxidase [Actinokineospora baliensis]
MTNPAHVIPVAGQAIQTLTQALQQDIVPLTTLMLTAVRASQINSGSACLHADITEARKAGVTEDQLATVAAWRDSPFFTEAERAALALAEAAARQSDRSTDAVPDALWDDLVTHYDVWQRAVLILWIATSNLFNTINNVIREPGGTTWI